MRTFVRAIVTAAFFLLVSATAFSQQVARTIPNASSPEGLIGFLEFRPTDYGSQKHPLIIFLHGIGERGDGTTQINSVANNAIPYYCANGATMRFTVNGRTSSFVVLSPQLSSNFGYWPTFYVKEMIRYAKANLKIDTNRIYVTGLSLGGGGVWRVITDTENFDHSFDGTIAAAAPVCGTQEMSDADFCTTIGTNHLPVWAFHCVDDGMVSVAATEHAEVLANICGVTPAAKFTYYQSGGHVGAWLNAYDTGHITRTISTGANFTANPNIYEWFLSNSRGGSTPPANTPPVASAGVDQTITLPTSLVSLSGSGAGTNGASISGYTWTELSGPSSAAIANAGAAATAVTGLVQGSYVFSLTVIDNNGLSNSANVNVTVNGNTANTAPIANAGNAQTATLPTDWVNLNGSGTGINGATISAYAWTQASGPSTAVIGNPNAASTSVSRLVQGSYVFTLTVTDNHGLTNSASVTVTVNAASSVNTTPQYPTANPGLDRSITLPATLTLDASGSSSPNGYITTYRWTQTSGPAGPAMTNRDAQTTDVTGLVPGNYVFVLQVTDNSGIQASASVAVTVNGASSAAGNLLGYIKLSVGPYQACGDTSSTDRMPVYGTGIANGSLLYSDAAMTQIYDGGWNWYSFTTILGGPTTYAFAIYPNGSIGLLQTCSNGWVAARAVMATTATIATSAEQDMATLQRMKDSAQTAASFTGRNTKLVLYPNPVHTNATIELNSKDNGLKTIYMYDAAGVLKTRYSWQTIKGRNTFPIKDIQGLANGLYIINVRDNAGKSVGSLKFLKM